MAMYLTQQKENLEDMGSLGLEAVLPGITIQLMALQLQPSLVDRIPEARTDDPRMQQLRRNVDVSQRTDALIHLDGSLRLECRIYVLEGDIKEELLEETHRSRYMMHPGNMKMYRDLYQHF